MSDNLLQPNNNGQLFFYHPLTRAPIKPHRMTILMTTGELIEEPHVAPKLAFRASLTPRDVVDYYYAATGNKSTAHVNRDVGTIKYLVRNFGLDKTLFAIDALVNDYNDGDTRGSHAPDLIKAADWMTEAEDRMGEVATIARQYRVNS